MKTIFCMLAAVLLASSSLGASDAEKLFELRTYHPAPGKMDSLHARFRNHATRLLEKHGIMNVGYWVPQTNAESKMLFIIAFPDLEARERMWKEFGSDPAWREAVKESERDGKLVAKAESVFLKPVDFSPDLKVQASSNPRLFELRTYKAAPGKLDALLARFRDHTTKLFAKHGITQLGYWVPTQEKDGSGDTLIYLLAHKDREAMEKSFKGFRADPEWLKARSDSEVNGPLTVKDGVQSLLLNATDYSPMK